MALQRRRRKQIVAVAMVSVASFALFIAYPPSVLLTPSQEKPVILYFRYGAPPFQIPQFPSIVNFTLQHGFNTIMMVVFPNHQVEYNKSTLEYFISYGKSRGLTFVPSYYIRSMNDQINVTGLPWVNLDMEKLTPLEQLTFFNEVAQTVPLVSVTMPYGVPMQFHTPMKIVETYAAPPLFWVSQLGYYHPGKICSVDVFLLHNQQEYDEEKDYCLKYSDGVMVFDYYWLFGSGFN